jgi:acyl-CoA synthetase (AMP-forming)/AMP-acid ligase II
MIITEILARNARLYGEEVALVEREPAKNLRRAITWKEFDDLANKVANALIAKGVKKGDKVIHLMMNCSMASSFRNPSNRAQAVPLNFVYRRRHPPLRTLPSEGHRLERISSNGLTRSEGPQGHEISSFGPSEMKQPCPTLMIF